MRSLLIMAIWIGVASVLMAGGKKPEKMRLTFHLEGQRTDNPKMVFPAPTSAGVKIFQRIPVVRTEEFVSFKPFYAKDGSVGASFKLNPVAAKRLAAFTTQENGKWLLAAVNGKPSSVVYINRPVRDGTLVVWSGMTQNDVKRFDFMMPRTGETSEEWAMRKKILRKQKKKKS